MTEGSNLKIISSIRSVLTKLNTPEEVLQVVGRLIIRCLGADLVYINYLTSRGNLLVYSNRNDEKEDSYLKVNKDELYFHNIILDTPVFCRDIGSALLPIQFKTLEGFRGTRSLGIVAIERDGKIVGWIECRFFKKFCNWNQRDTFILREIAVLCGDFAEEKIVRKAQTQSRNDVALPKSNWPVLDALKESGKMFLIRTDRKGVILDIYGKVEEVFGLSALNLFHNDNIWQQLIQTKDLIRLRKNIDESRETFSQELYVTNLTTGKKSCLHATFSPLFEDNELNGWECCCLDMTGEKNEEVEILRNHQELNILYELSLNLQSQKDSHSTLQGALDYFATAVKADAAYILTHDKVKDSFKIQADFHLSDELKEKLNLRLAYKNTLADYIIRTQKPFRIPDLTKSKFPDMNVVSSEDNRSALIFPFILKKGKENDTAGLIAIFSQNLNAYQKQCFNFISQAVSLLTTRLQQFFDRKNALDSYHTLSILYKVSSNLKTSANQQESVKNVLTLLNNEVNCRRIWLGELDDIASSVMARGACGLKHNKLLAKIKINLKKSEESMFYRTIHNKEAVFLNSIDEISQPVFYKLLKKFNIKHLQFIPLITKDKCVGIIVIEPYSLQSFRDIHLPLIQKAADELADYLHAGTVAKKVAENDKLQTVSVFASGLAHSFNNTFQTIMGQASLITMQENDFYPTNDKASKNIISASQRGARMVHQLITLTGQTPLTQKAFSLNNLLNDSMEIYESLLDSNIKFEIKTELKLPNIYADFNQMQQVITALISNAKDAVAGVSYPQIEIATERVTLKDGEIDPDIQGGDYICLSVTDNGCGMDENALHRCFEPFFTTKNIDLKTGIGVHSSGLSLSLSYAIVKRHKGTIVVKNNQNGGCTFYVFLPIYKKDNKIVYDENSALKQALILDDDDERAAILIDVLSKSQICGANFSNTKEFLDSLKRNLKVSVLIINIDLISEHTVTFIKQIRSKYQNALLLALSQEPEKWSGLLRYVADTRVFQIPLNKWTIDAISDLISHFDIFLPTANDSPFDEEDSLDIMNLNSEIVVEKDKPDDKEESFILDEDDDIVPTRRTLQ